MKSIKQRSSQRFAVVAAAAMMGTAFGLIPSCEGILTTFNPCGTVLEFCEPYEIDTLFGSVPDYSLDPTCTIPFFGITGDGSTSSEGSCYAGVLDLGDLDF